MLKEIVLGQVRHLLTTVGGSLVASGMFTADEMTSLVGAGVIIVGAVWSAFTKRKAKENREREYND